jgi:peptidoglycan hydrolase-like protein with peptidoglycan-binding domain
MTNVNTTKMTLVKIAIAAGVLFFGVNAVFANTFSTDLKRGSEGEEVVKLQTFLESKGFLVMPQGVAKGFFGDRTVAALAAYQAKAGIVPPAGYFGPVTRAKINAESAAAPASSMTSTLPVIKSVTISGDQTVLTIVGTGFSKSKSNTVLLTNVQKSKVLAWSDIPSTKEGTVITMALPTVVFTGDYLIVSVKNNETNLTSTAYTSTSPVPTATYGTSGGATSGSSGSGSGSQSQPTPSPSGSPSAFAPSEINLASIWAAIESILAR